MTCSIMQQITNSCLEVCSSPSIASDDINKIDEISVESKQNSISDYSTERMVDLQGMIQKMALENNQSNINQKQDLTPSRELYFANADVSQEDMWGLLQQCGELKHLSKPTDMQHVWFAVYYDIRAAQIAMNTFQGNSIDGVQAPLEIYPKTSWTDKEGLGEDCLIISNIDPTQTPESINTIFSRFGEISDSVILPDNRRAVKFYDLRSVEAAYNQFVGSGVVSKPVEPHQINTSAGLVTSDSVSSFGGQQTGFGGLPLSTGLPFVSTADVGQLMGLLPQTAGIPQLGMLQGGDNMSLDPLNRGGFGSTPTLASLAFPSVSSPAASLASLAYSSPGMGSPANMPGAQSTQLAQIMAAAQAQALINAAQGILRSASLGSLDLSQLAQQQNEAMRRAEMVKKYSLDIEKIKSGEDTRTTLMIKNIPNKYTPQMILDTINDAGIAGHYDFLYLPLDFRNRCNVGYAFINMRDSVTGVPLLYNEFNGRRWERFNSEKVSQVTYARIQGKEQLVNHFQNSSLMLEDEACRPMLFNENGEIEKFPVGPDVQPRIVEDKVGSVSSNSAKDEEQ